MTRCNTIHSPATGFAMLHSHPPRRPGYWMWRIDWSNGPCLATAEAAPDRHFFGHAVLAPNGRT
ncbi:DUF1513 domain-containing protein, partial [Azoarcus communis SWub3 = DSM 12120]|nr:DUF1513 domain-containing protein [Parazoarcus communis SWub3 = DSM 12120]